MNEPTEKDPCTPPHEAALARALETALASGQIGPKDLARLLLSRPSAPEPNLRRIDGWMKRVERRVGQIEAHLKALANRSDEQEEGLKMICSILKDMDDPYGFGLSLDERIKGDSHDWEPDDQDG